MLRLCFQERLFCLSWSRLLVWHTLGGLLRFSLGVETGGPHLYTSFSALLQPVGVISQKWLLHEPGAPVFAAATQRMPLDLLALVAIFHWSIKNQSLERYITSQGLRVNNGRWWELGQPTPRAQTSNGKSNFSVLLTLVRGLKISIFFTFIVPILLLILIYLQEIITGIF